MERFLAALVLGSAAITQLAVAHAQSQRVSEPKPDLKSATESGNLTVLPPAPGGKSTILGGEIRNVDPVLDQFTLKVYGQRPLKILFDERTQVFRNGTRIPLRDLHPEEHASVQTVLDGGNIFALSIHTLSQAPEGECEGAVVSYDAIARELAVRSNLSREPIKLLLRDQTQISREGQQSFTAAGSGVSDLVNGSLVVIRFEANGKGQAIANHVTVLARPGSNFIFSGKLSSFDMHSGVLVIVDPRDDKTYQISFDPAAIPGSGDLHVGDQIRVDATLDNGRYKATQITAQTPQP